MGSVGRLAWGGYIKWLSWTSTAALEREYRERLNGGGPVQVQIGAAAKSLPGWINTDINPRVGYYLDATKQLPFDADSVDLIFNEQFIEHIPFQEAQSFLSESFRVLKPGGVIRITTQSLETHVHEYLQRSDAAHQMLSRNQSKGHDYGPTVAALINKMFYADAHAYIYDFETMECCLTAVGFVDVTSCSVGESSHSPLRGIEQHWVGTIHDHFCLVIEGTKPSGPSD